MNTIDLDKYSEVIKLVLASDNPYDLNNAIHDFDVLGTFERCYDVLTDYVQCNTAPLESNALLNECIAYTKEHLGEIPNVGGEN